MLERLESYKTKQSYVNPGDVNADDFNDPAKRAFATANARFAGSLEPNLP